MGDKRKVWLNGEIIPWQDATVHTMSHSLSRGSAVFEIFSVHETPDGKAAAFRFDKHMMRLRNSTELLGMELAQSEEEIKEAVEEVVKINNVKDGFVKIMAYYGQQSFSVVAPDAPLDMVIFAVSWGAVKYDPGKSESACICKWRKLHPETVPVEAKVAGNYVNGMLSRQDAKKRGFNVGILLDTQGFMTEGSTEAIFIVKDNVLTVPPLGTVLSSITRMAIVDAAKKIGMAVSERLIRKDEILDADEMFTAGTPIKVMPVDQIEDRMLENVPGPVTIKVAKMMEEICNGSDERFKDWLFPLE